MENLHLIEAYYLAPTNTMGARIKLISHRFGGESVTLSWDYDHDNISAQAEIYLTKHGHKVIGHCETQRGYGVLCAAEDGMFQHLHEETAKEVGVSKPRQAIPVRKNQGRQFNP